MRALVLAAGLLTLMPALVAANNGFFSRDLGAGGTGAECLARAQATLRSYLDRNGLPRAAVETGNWTTAIFGVTPARADVQIACPYRDNRSDVVLLTVHSTGTEAEREAIADAVTDIWDRTPATGTPPRTK